MPAKKKSTKKKAPAKKSSSHAKKATSKKAAKSASHKKSKSSDTHKTKAKAAPLSKSSSESTMMMKKSGAVVLGLIAVIVIIFMIVSSKEAPQQIGVEEGNTAAGTVVARVDGVPINMEELDTEYNALPDVYKQSLTKSQYLERVMVLQTLLKTKSSGVTADRVDSAYQEYLSLNGLTEESALTVLSEQGVTLDGFKDLIRIQLFLNETLYDQIEVTEQEMMDFYDANQANILDDDGSQMSYDDSKGQVNDFLYAQKLQVATQEYVTQLQSEADIEILLTE